MSRGQYNSWISGIVFLLIICILVFGIMTSILADELCKSNGYGHFTGKYVRTNGAFFPWGHKVLEAECYGKPSGAFYAQAIEAKCYNKSLCTTCVRRDEIERSEEKGDKK